MKYCRNLYLPATLAALAAMAALACSGCRDGYPPETEEKIRLVENSLSGWVRTGSNDTWNLEERMKQNNIRGVSIAVINNYKVEWARGYGYADVSENRKVTESTLFQAASISKSLNSLGVMLLAQQGKLSLDSNINDYLKTWKFPYDEKSNNKTITLKNLLSHTAGLTMHGFPGYEPGADLPGLPQILDGTPPANTDPVRSFTEPGGNFSYSGGGTTISQLIVTDVTNEAYDKFMQKNVLLPLGMKSSSFTQPPDPKYARRLATGYRADGNEVRGKYHVYPEQAAAGLWTTPSDLCKYVIETQLAWEGKSSKVLTPEMMTLRLTPVSGDAALGCFVNSRVTGSVKYFNHNGGNEGFSCTAIGSLENGYGVVIMTNTDNGSIIEEIANSVAIAYNWKDYYLPETKQVIEIPDSVAKRYAGKYDNNGQPVSFRQSSSGLEVNALGDVWWPVMFTSMTDFFIREFRGNLKFIVDENNSVTGFGINGFIARKTE
jgi:CubicO group peptidase (beta-lactamase class C family)